MTKVKSKTDKVMEIVSSLLSSETINGEMLMELHARINDELNTRIAETDHADALRRKAHMMKLCDAFKDFVSESIDEGIFDGWAFDSEYVFLDQCMTRFADSDD